MKNSFVQKINRRGGTNSGEVTPITNAVTS